MCQRMAEAKVGRRAWLCCHDGDDVFDVLLLVCVFFFFLENIRLSWHVWISRGKRRQVVLVNYICFDGIFYAIGLLHCMVFHMESQQSGKLICFYKEEFIFSLKIFELITKTY